VFSNNVLLTGLLLWQLCWYIWVSTSLHEKIAYFKTSFSIVSFSLNRFLRVE